MFQEIISNEILSENAKNISKSENQVFAGSSKDVVNEVVCEQSHECLNKNEFNDLSNVDTPIASCSGIAKKSKVDRKLELILKRYNVSEKELFTRLKNFKRKTKDKHKSNCVISSKIYDRFNKRSIRKRKSFLNKKSPNKRKNEKKSTKKSLKLSTLLMGNQSYKTNKETSDGSLQNSDDLRNNSNIPSVTDTGQPENKTPSNAQVILKRCFDDLKLINNSREKEIENENMDDRNNELGLVIDNQNFTSSSNKAKESTNTISKDQIETNSEYLNNTDSSKIEIATSSKNSLGNINSLEIPNDDSKLNSKNKISVEINITRNVEDELNQLITDSTNKSSNLYSNEIIDNDIETKLDNSLDTEIDNLLEMLDTKSKSNVEIEEYTGKNETNIENAESKIDNETQMDSGKISKIKTNESFPDNNKPNYQMLGLSKKDNLELNINISKEITENVSQTEEQKMHNIESVIDNTELMNIDKNKDIILFKNSIVESTFNKFELNINLGNVNTPKIETNININDFSGDKIKSNSDDDNIENIKVDKKQNINIDELKIIDNESRIGTSKQSTTIKEVKMHNIQQNFDVKQSRVCLDFIQTDEIKPETSRSATKLFDCFALSKISETDNTKIEIDNLKIDNVKSVSNKELEIRGKNDTIIENIQPKIDTCESNINTSINSFVKITRFEKINDESNQIKSDKSEVDTNISEINTDVLKIDNIEWKSKNPEISSCESKTHKLKDVATKSEITTFTANSREIKSDMTNIEVCVDATSTSESEMIAHEFKLNIVEAEISNTKIIRKIDEIEGDNDTKELKDKTNYVKLSIFENEIHNIKEDTNELKSKSIDEKFSISEVDTDGIELKAQINNAELSIPEGETDNTEEDNDSNELKLETINSKVSLSEGDADVNNAKLSILESETDNVEEDNDTNELKPNTINAKFSLPEGVSDGAELKTEINNVKLSIIEKKTDDNEENNDTNEIKPNIIDAKGDSDGAELKTEINNEKLSILEKETDNNEDDNDTNELKPETINAKFSIPGGDTDGIELKTEVNNVKLSIREDETGNIEEDNDNNKFEDETSNVKLNILEGKTDNSEENIEANESAGETYNEKISIPEELNIFKSKIEDNDEKIFISESKIDNVSLKVATDFKRNDSLDIKAIETDNIKSNIDTNEFRVKTNTNSGESNLKTHDSEVGSTLKIVKTNVDTNELILDNGKIELEATSEKMQLENNELESNANVRNLRANTTNLKIDTTKTEVNIIKTKKDIVQSNVDSIGTDKVETETDKVKTGVDNVKTEANKIDAEADKVGAKADEVETSNVKAKADNVEAEADNIEFETNNIEVEVGKAEQINIEENNIEIGVDNIEVKQDNVEIETEAEVYNVVEVNNIEVEVHKIAEAVSIEIKAENIETETNNVETKARNIEAEEGNMEIETNNMVIETKNIKTKSDNAVIKAYNVVIEVDNVEVEADTIETEADNVEIKVEPDNAIIEVKNVKAETENLKVESDSAEVDADNVEVEADSVEPDNIEADANSVEVFADSTQVGADKVEVEVDKVEVRADSVEVEADDIEIVADNVEVKSDNVEVQADSVEVQSDDVEIIAESVETEAESVEVETDGVEVIADSVEVKSDSVEVEAESVEVETDDVEVIAHNIEVKADNVEVEAESVEVETDDVKVKGDNIEVKADNVEVVADRAEVKADSIEVEANSVEVKADSIEVKSDSVEVEANSVEVKSDSVEVGADSIEVETDNIEVKAESVQVKADDVEIIADSVQVKADSVEVEADKVEVKADNVDIDADSTEVKADSTDVEADKVEVKADNVEIDADSTEVKADSTDVEADNTEVEADNIKIVSDNNEIESDNIEVKADNVEIEIDKIGTEANSFIVNTKKYKIKSLTIEFKKDKIEEKTDKETEEKLAGVVKDDFEIKKDAVQVEIDQDDSETDEINVEIEFKTNVKGKVSNIEDKAVEIEKHEIETDKETDLNNIESEKDTIKPDKVQDEIDKNTELQIDCNKLKLKNNANNIEDISDSDIVKSKKELKDSINYKDMNIAEAKIDCTDKVKIYISESNTVKDKLAAPKSENIDIKLMKMDIVGTKINIITTDSSNIESKLDTNESIVDNSETNINIENVEVNTKSEISTQHSMIDDAESTMDHDEFKDAFKFGAKFDQQSTITNLKLDEEIKDSDQNENNKEERLKDQNDVHDEESKSKKQKHISELKTDEDDIKSYSKDLKLESHKINFKEDNKSEVTTKNYKIEADTNNLNISEEQNVPIDEHESGEISANENVESISDDYQFSKVINKQENSEFIESEDNRVTDHKQTSDSKSGNCTQSPEVISNKTDSSCNSSPQVSIVPLHFNQTNDDLRDKIKQQLELLRTTKKIIKTKSISMEESEDIEKPKPIVNNTISLNDVLLSNEGDHLIVSVVGGYQSEGEDEINTSTNVEENDEVNKITEETNEIRTSIDGNYINNNSFEGNNEMSIDINVEENSEIFNKLDNKDKITDILLKRDLSRRSSEDSDDLKMLAIKPTKTTDITKIKGWRTKIFSIDEAGTSKPLDFSTDENFDEITIEEHPLEETGSSKDVIKNYIDISMPSTSKTGLNEELGDDDNILKQGEKANNNIFVSDMLDSFLSNDAELKISYEVPKLVAEEAISKPETDLPIPPNSLLIPIGYKNVRVINRKPIENAFKAKTLAEKRKLLEIERQNKLVSSMESNESTYLKQLEKGDIRNSVIKSIRNNLIREETPISKRCWQLATRNDQECMKYALINGEKIRIIGSTGGKDIVIKNYYNKKLRLNNLWKKDEDEQETKNVLDKSSRKIEYKPGPLSKKHKLVKCTGKSKNFEYEVRKMPIIKLILYPQLGKKIPLTAERYLHICKDERGFISDEWAKFAVSAVSTSNPKPVKIEFEIPYANYQNKILLRKIVKDPVLKQIKINKYPLIKVEEEIKDIVSEMLDCIDNQSLDNFIIKDDPDIKDLGKETKKEDYKPPSPTDPILQAVIKRRNTKKSKTTLELRRLNVQVIEVDVQEDENSCDTKTVCTETFCHYGCVCRSLSGVGSSMPDHCGRESCMFECSCSISLSHQNNHHSVTLPAGTDLLSTSTMVRLQDEAVKHLAKEEKKFTQTVIKANNQTIVVGGGARERQRRVSKVPKKFNDYVNTTEELPNLLQDLNNISEKDKDKDKEKEKEKQDIKIATRKVVPIWKNTKKSKNKNDYYKNCYVRLHKMDVNDILPWCMVHNLYKCWCGGAPEITDTTLAAKPLEKDESEYVTYEPRYGGRRNQKTGDNSEKTMRKYSRYSYYQDDPYTPHSEAKQRSSLRKQDIEKTEEIPPPKVVPDSEENCARTRTVEKNYVVRNNTPKYKKEFAKLRRTDENENALEKYSEKRKTTNNSNERKRSTENNDVMLFKKIKLEKLKPAPKPLEDPLSLDISDDKISVNIKTEKSMSPEYISDEDVKPRNLAALIQNTPSAIIPDDSVKERVKIASLIDYEKSFMGLLIPTESWKLKFQRMLNMKNVHIRHIRLLQWNCLLDRYRKSLLQLWWKCNNVILTENKKRPSQNHMNIRLFEKTEMIENFKIPEIIMSILSNRLPGTAQKSEETFVILVCDGNDWEARGTIVLNNTGDQCKQKLIHRPTPASILYIEPVLQQVAPKSILKINDKPKLDQSTLDLLGRINIKPKSSMCVTVKNKSDSSMKTYTKIVAKKTEELTKPSISKSSVVYDEKDVLTTSTLKNLLSTPETTLSKTGEQNTLDYMNEQEKIKAFLATIPSTSELNRWYMLKLENDFSILRINSTQFHIKYTHLTTAIQMAKRNNKIVRIRSHNRGFVRPNNTFGIYAVPEFDDRIFFGPYAVPDDHGLETFRYVNGKLVNTKIYHKMRGNMEKRTTGAWFTNSSVKTSNISKSSKVDYVDLTKNDSDDESSQKKSSVPDDPLFNVLTADFSKNLSEDITIERISEDGKKVAVNTDSTNLKIAKFSERKPTDYVKKVDIKQFLLNQDEYDSTPKRKKLSTVCEKKDPPQKMIEVINLDDDLPSPLEQIKNAKEARTAQIENKKGGIEKKKIPQLYPISALKKNIVTNNPSTKVTSVLKSNNSKLYITSNIKNFGCIEVIMNEDMSYEVINIVSLREKQFNDARTMLLFLEDFFKEKIKHFPSNLSLELNIFASDGPPQQEFNENYLNGFHIVCQKGVYDLLKMDTELNNLCLTPEETRRAVELKCTLIINKYMQNLGRVIYGGECEKWEESKILDVAHKKIIMLEFEENLLTTEKKSLIQHQKKLVSKLNTMLEDVPPEHAVSVRINVRNILSKNFKRLASFPPVNVATKRRKSVQKNESTALPAGKSIKIVDNKIVNMQQIQKSQDANEDALPVQYKIVSGTVLKPVTNGLFKKVPLIKSVNMNYVDLTDS